MAKYEQIYSLYEKALEDGFFDFDKAILIYVFLLGLVIFTILISAEVGLLYGIAVAAIVGFLVFNVTSYIDYRENELKSEWVQKHEIPFIEKLPTEKILVEQYVFIDYEDGHSKFTRSTKNEKIETLRIQGKFEDTKRPVELTLNVKIKEKDNIKQPYVLVKKLEKDLPLKFKKGYYNATLYLPSESEK